MYRMYQLTFLGATGVVTGSSYHLKGQSTSLLIDFGLFQEDKKTEEQNRKSLPFEVTSLSGVLVTHAHLDHCGRLPLLAQEGYSGQIFMTQATRDIVEISLRDSAKIAERKEDEEEIEALYTTEDVEKTLEMIKPIAYDEPFQCGEFTVTFRDAGHILGSASIEIADPTGKIIVFSGDLGNTPEDIVEPTDLITKANYIVMESTYGDRKHTLEDVYAVLQHEINEIEQTNGVLIIPAFSIERTQEIIHRIGHLIEEKKISPKTSIFVDSPMAIAVTEVFKNYPHLYNKETAADSEPFEFDSLIPTQSSQESKDILHAKNPKVIIAGSGMMSGGRVLFHLKNYISQHNTRLLIVGYQAEGTLGRKIEEGARSIHIFDEEISVNATITKLESMSSHADKPKLLAWLKHISGVEKVFLTHGEEESRQNLAKAIKEELHIPSVELPQSGETVEL